MNRLWTHLADPEWAVLRETWPQRRDLAFMQALAEEAPEREAEVQRAHRFLNGLLRVPVVAVAGLLNAGKSSLVASFLSREGRARVLRGVGRASGTHRFTLWCPARWEREPMFREALEALLAGVFGERAQGLSLPPEEAHDQQRERRRLSGPLLAFDPGLDEHGLCLLDCPDIQRHEEGDGTGHSQRRQMLEAASRICSAVFVVLPRSQLEVEQVAEVLNALPRALRALLVNLCSGESPESIAAEARAAWGDKADLIYIAYDFRLKGYEDHTAEWDPNRQLPNDAIPTEAVPCFFLVTPERAEGRTATTTDLSLLAFARQVTPERLLQERQRELLHEFRRRILNEGERLAVAAAAKSERLRAAGNSLQDELVRLLERDGDLCIKLDPRLIEDFATSIRRTAPWDLKPFLWVSQKAASALRAIRSVVKGVSDGISARIQEEGRRIGAVLAEGRLDADRIADRLRLWSASQGQPRDRLFWLPIAERILEQFQQQTDIRLPDAEWDERARDLWRAVPIWRARAAVLTTVLVAMAAVALLSVAGGPVLLALGLKSAALTVTVKELLVVVGLGSIAQGEAARRLDEWLRQRVGNQQRAQLVRVAFDEVGLPRRLLLDSPMTEADADAQAPCQDGFAVRELGGSWRTWLSGNWNVIRKDLDALGN